LSQPGISLCVRFVAEENLYTPSKYPEVRHLADSESRLYCADHRQTLFSEHQDGWRWSSSLTRRCCYHQSCRAIYLGGVMGKMQLHPEQT
jgi:hypothetical protein